MVWYQRAWKQLSLFRDQYNDHFLIFIYLVTKLVSI